MNRLYTPCWYKHQSQYYYSSASSSLKNWLCDNVPFGMLCKPYVKIMMQPVKGEQYVPINNGVAPPSLGICMSGGEDIKWKAISKEGRQDTVPALYLYNNLTTSTNPFWAAMKTGVAPSCVSMFGSALLCNR